MKFASCIFLASLFLSCGVAPNASGQSEEGSKPTKPVRPGVADFPKLIELIGNQRLAVVTNHTGMIGDTHIVDSLLSMSVDVKNVFAPEHGFRGDRPDGELLGDGVDQKTGVPVISLYGKNKKPSNENLEDVDVILFDIQDVGARFYTYLSSLHYVMQACAENGITLIVADRPNPNIRYVDGPVLEKEFSSFVGLHAVPIVYGMTIGEYALMLNGEGWHEAKTCELTVLPCLNYSRSSSYDLPVRPSPNLPTMESVYLYPSICLLEGTNVSVGRGTDSPFAVIGAPDNTTGNYEFTPEPKKGASVNPKHKGVSCTGYDLSEHIPEPGKMKMLDLSWLCKMYEESGNKEAFFLKSGYFEKLAGTRQIRADLVAGKSPDEIRASWSEGLEDFKSIREKYLLYED